MADEPMAKDPGSPTEDREDQAEVAPEAGDVAGQGAKEIAAGAEDIAYAHDLADNATAEAALAASDLTRAIDASIVADRLSALSDVVAAAGVNDIDQGTELIAAAGDVEVVSAAVGLMSVADLEKGLELGRLAGELRVVGRILDQLEMPVMSAVLGDRGERLTEIATDTILRAAATRSLTDLIEATGQRIGDMGVEEVDEGMLRLAAADIASERAAGLSASGLALGARAVDGLDQAATDADLAEELEAYGVDEVASGAQNLGESATAAEEAEARDTESQNPGEPASS